MMFRTEVMPRVAKRPAVREIQGNEGLCRDCVAADTCTFPRDPSRPVWSCDEFEGTESIPTRYPAPAWKTPALPTGVEQMVTAAELKGLCRECANRHTCQYPKPPGGVWHCEELA